MRRAGLAAAAATALLVGSVAGEARANGRFPSAEQLVVDPTDPAHIEVQVTYGFIHTRDDGATWYWTCEDAAGYGGVLDPPIAVLDGGKLIAGVFDGLVVGSPEGCNLGFVPGDLAGRFFVDVSANKTEPTRAIAVSSNGLGGNVFDTRLWASDDTGATWAQAGASLPDDFLALTADAAPSNDQRIYLSGFAIPSSDNYIGTLARSSDGGATWEMLPIPGSNNQAGPYIAAIAPGDPDTVYVRLDSDLGKLLVTRDAGETWESVFDATSPLLGFALSPDGSEVRVGTETDGIHGARTDDLVFTQVSTLGVRCLTWAGDRLYACAKEAVSGFTIGRSTDKGATFEAIHHLSCLGGPDPACAAGTSVTDACVAKWAAQMQILQTDLCAAASTSSSSSGGGTAPDGDGDSGDDGCGCVVPSNGNDTPVSFVVALLAIGVGITGLRRLPRRAPTSAQSDR